MSLVLQELDHGKEDDSIHDKADNHSCGSLQAGKTESDSCHSIGNKKCCKDAHDEDYQFFKDPVSIPVLTLADVFNISAVYSRLLSRGTVHAASVECGCIKKKQPSREKEQFNCPSLLPYIFTTLSQTTRQSALSWSEKVVIVECVSIVSIPQTLLVTDGGISARNVRP